MMHLDASATVKPFFLLFLTVTFFIPYLFPLAVCTASIQYAYDIQHRLISAEFDNGVKFNYSYDKLGNRLSESSTRPTTTIYEDAENGNISGWDIYDSDPAAATIANIYDEQRANRVIEFTGAGTANGYRLKNDNGAYWYDSNLKVMQWSMRYSENFVVYIAVQTRNGFRYLYYTPVETDKQGTGTYIHHGLGAYAKDGTWHTLIRDLAYDLKVAQPDNELESVLGFLIRGSGRVDDIKTLEKIPATQDSDGDSLSDNDEISLYGTHPYDADSDDDGLNDGEELKYWGTNWQSDPDGDGLINILDPDADQDTILDGIEALQGTNPADAASFPTRAVYEDAENGDISGWDIYDSDPAGAIIANIFDEKRASRVIEFTGAATTNGYRLTDSKGAYWYDTNFKVMQWSMCYSEHFVVYIAVQTRDGFRYLYYTPEENDKLGTETYIHHGLGAYVKDGEWHTLIRDLAYDLKEAQPENELEAVLGFLIRGSGRVDDIKTLADIPADQDSDGDMLTDRDEIFIFGTHPYYADTDDDGIFDGEELSYWAANWNNDPDSDGLINIIDPDSDGDGFNDGMEVLHGTNPADAASFSARAIYEDAEDSTVTGWDIYDNDPAGANVANVFDDARASRVIELAGGGTANGYRLRNNDGTYWYDTNFRTLEWSMKFSEDFTVYIATQTKDGFRYLYYTPVNTNSLGADQYVHHGLGSSIKDGMWHTLTRDLEADLKEAQPDNELQAILGFLIRGNGRVDDIKTQ